MIKKLTALRTKKLLFPSLTTFFIGLEGVLFSLIGYAIIANNLPETVIVPAAMGIWETFSLIIALFVLGFKKLPSLFKKFKSKKGAMFIFATILGTTIGNVFLFLSVSLAGPSYGVVLTALYPIFSMLLIKFFLKEKEKWQVWFGVFLTFFGAVMFIMFPALFNSGQHNSSWLERILGIGFGMLTGFFWAIESLFIKRALIMKEGPHFSDFEINTTRHVFSWASTWIMVMPLMMFFGNTFGTFASFVSNWKVVLICLAMAVNLLILRIFHVQSIKIVGPKITALFESNNFIVPSFLSFVLFLLPVGLDGKTIFEMMDWQPLLILIPIVLGVWMTLYFHEDDEKQIQTH